MIQLLRELWRTHLWHPESFDRAEKTPRKGKKCDKSAMILAGSGIAAGGTGNANFLEIQINIPPEDDNDPSQDDDDPPEDDDDLN